MSWAWRLWREVPLQQGPCPPCPFTGKLQQPRHDCTEIGLPPGHHCPGQLPFCNYLHGLVNTLQTYHDLYLLGIGLGWYDQWQNILIMPVICKLTPTYPKYGMADPPTPSSSNNLSRGWISRAICPQNPEVTLETFAPKSINVITSHPSMMVGTSFDHLTK